MRAAFLGSKRLGLTCLDAIRRAAPDCIAAAITFDDRSDPRNAFADFQSYCNAAGLRLDIARNQRHAERLTVAIAPDLCFVVGWYWLISNAAIGAVPKGYIGIHNSLLPKFRGGSPLVWALIQGETEVGCSIYSLGRGMDDGPVWGRCRVQVAENDAIGDVLQQLETAAANWLEGNVAAILNGDMAPTPQDETLASWCAQRTPADGEIDWSMPAKRVHDFIRAQSDPYPGAFSLHEGAPLTFLRSRWCDSLYYGIPGQVAAVAPTGVKIVCGDDRCIEATEVRREGSTLPAAEVLRSIRIRLPRRPIGVV